MSRLWPLLIYGLSAVLLVAGMLALSYLLGQRHRERATTEPYESGIASTGTARLRFDVMFYLVAVLFVIFDVESVFVFAWAAAAREAGWAGYMGIAFFIGVLFVMLLYLWRLGVLDWAPSSRTGQREEG